MKNIHILPTDKPSKLFIDVDDNKLKICVPLGGEHMMNQNIYITNNEDIKDYDWYISLEGKLLQFTGRNVLGDKFKAPKVILTTDDQLIKDSVQAIPDEFLEWFVKNPSCEFVEVENFNNQCMGECGICDNSCGNWYKIIIPQEEPKQETLEEVYLRNIQEYAEQNLHHKETVEKAAEKHWKMQYIMALDESIKPYIIEDFIAGAKSDAARDYWFEQFNNKQQKQAKTMYSEEELLEFGKLVLDTFHSEGKTKSGKDRLARVKFNKWFEQFKKK
jgi:hypothetical protein